MPSRNLAGPVYFLAMHRLLTLLMVLPLAACERLPADAEPPPIEWVPEVSVSEGLAPDVPASEDPVPEDPMPKDPAPKVSQDAPPRELPVQKAAPRGSTPVVQLSPDGRLFHNAPAETNEPPRVRELLPIADDPMHGALLRSRGSETLARIDTARAVPVTSVVPDEVAGTQGKAPGTMREEVVFPGSVVM